MSTPAAFQATYSDWKLIRSRKVVQIVMEVPLEAAGQAYDVLGGMPRPDQEAWVAIARLEQGRTGSLVTSQEQSPTEAAPAPDVTPPKPVRAAPASIFVRQAAICCTDPVFQRFLYEFEYAEGMDENYAAAAVRRECCVKSRKEIIPGSQAAEAWDRLWSRFLAWKIAA